MQLTMVERDQSQTTTRYHEMERPSHPTREHTKWAIGFELAERHFQFELRDSRLYQRAGLSFHKTEEFGLMVPVPSPSNLTTTTNAERTPSSKHQAPGYGSKRNQTYENSHSSSTADKICSILEPIESRLNLAIAKQDFKPSRKHWKQKLIPMRCMPQPWSPRSGLIHNLFQPSYMRPSSEITGLSTYYSSAGLPTKPVSETKRLR